MIDSVQYSMTTVTLEGADRAMDAGEWLNANSMNYEINMEPWTTNNPIYHFKFFNENDASYFALKWR